MKRDLSKQVLYESVKLLVDLEDAKHIHLNQHKLYTLFSIAFQYLLFRSTKKSGAYVIRVEDSHLAEKLSRKAKDPSSRRFMQSLLLPRKLKYNKSVFYLDFFHMGSWKITNDIPKERVQGALVIKNTSSKPLVESSADELDEYMLRENVEDDQTIPEAELEAESLNGFDSFKDNYFLTSLQEFVPKTVTIAYDINFESVQTLSFPFIKKKSEKALSGVTLANDLDLDEVEK